LIGINDMPNTVVVVTPAMTETVEEELAEENSLAPKALVAPDVALVVDGEVSMEAIVIGMV
jgi:hypothetical protein